MSEPKSSSRPMRPPTSKLHSVVAWRPTVEQLDDLPSCESVVREFVARSETMAFIVLSPQALEPSETALQHAQVLAQRMGAPADPAETMFAGRVLSLRRELFHPTGLTLHVFNDPCLFLDTVKPLFVSSTAIAVTEKDWTQKVGAATMRWLT